MCELIVRICPSNNVLPKNFYFEIWLGVQKKSFVKVDVITISQELQVKETFANAEVVVAGLCNIYTHYITTYEEYQVCMLENT